MIYLKIFTYVALFLIPKVYSQSISNNSSFIKIINDMGGSGYFLFDLKVNISFSFQFQVNVLFRAIGLVAKNDSQDPMNWHDI